jgi:hypothetical protein
LDEIIIRQAVGLGRGILLSPIAFMRYLVWESQANFNLSRRFHQALERHWKIVYRRGTPPLPIGMREFKKEMITELRPVCKRLHKRFQSSHKASTLEEILQEFRETITELGCHHLANSSNMDSWRRFLAWQWQRKKRSALLSGFHSPVQLFEEWLAWSWRLEVETVEHYFSHQEIG